MSYTILVCLAYLLAVGSATIVDVKSVGTIEVDDDVPAHNPCTSGVDCLRSQLEKTLAYMPSADYNQDSDAYDWLSDDDALVMKSRNVSYWKSRNQKTLKQVLLIHRHGDRTPIAFSSKDNIGKEPFWYLHGLGQLTNRGKARLHLLGKITRHRYDEFLQKSVNKNIRKSRSSGSLRCIESAQVFLSSFLTLESSHESDAQPLIRDNQDDRLSHIWQPASVNTLAAKYDGMLNEDSHCENAEAEFASLDQSEVSKQLMEEYKHEREVLEQELGFVVDHFYKWYWASSALEVERSYFKSKLKPSVAAIYDRLQEVGNKALVLLQSTTSLRRARVGLLIDDMIKNMDNLKNSSTSPFNKKFVHYSAHDINLIYLLGVLDNIEKFPFRPDYASHIIFELHEDKGEWFLKLFYMPHVPSKYIELHMDACEQGHEKKRCTLAKFTGLMEQRQYRVPGWYNWMTELCGNSFTNMDPYNENS